jgi:hypothetical protein
MPRACCLDPLRMTFLDLPPPSRGRDRAGEGTADREAVPRAGAPWRTGTRRSRVVPSPFCALSSTTHAPCSSALVLHSSSTTHDHPWEDASTTPLVCLMCLVCPSAAPFRRTVGTKRGVRGDRQHRQHRHPRAWPMRDLGWDGKRCPLRRWYMKKIGSRGFPPYDTFDVRNRAQSAPKKSSRPSPSESGLLPC